MNMQSRTNDARTIDSKKKISYRGKSNKVPLRDRTRQEEVNRQLDEAEKAAKIKANQMLAEHRKREKAKKINKENDHKINKSGGADYVTLTQDQLATILSTIAKVQNDGKTVNVNISDDNLQLQLGYNDKNALTEHESIAKLEKKARHASSVLKTDRQLNGEAKKVTINSDKRKLPTKNHLSEKVEVSREYSFDDRVFHRGAANVVIVQDEPANSADSHTPVKTLQASLRPATIPDNTEPELSPRQKLLLIPKAHLTKGEKLRLKRDMENEVNCKLPSDQKYNSSQRNKESENKENSRKPKDTQQGSNNEKKNKTMSKTQVVEPSFVPGLGDVLSDGSVSHRGLTNEQLSASRLSEMPRFLTKTELKKLQWDKEKAFQALEYNPWGKPAAGVGPKITKHANQQLADQSDLIPPRSGPDNHSQPVQQMTQVNTRKAELQSPHVPSLNIAASHVVSNLQEPLQPNSQQNAAPAQAMLSKTEMMKIKWAIERVDGPQDYFPFGKPGCGAPIRSDSGSVLTNYQSRLDHLLRKSQEQQISQNATRAQQEHVSKGQPVLDALSNTAADSTHDDSLRTHLRGQMINLDSATMKEREDERKRHLQHQEDIRRQVEEKLRLKKEEELRKAKEEAEEEEKLRTQRNILQLQYEIEREQAKKKEEKETNRVDALREAMEKARLEAEALKARKRLEKLQKAGHNITHLKAAYEEKFVSPRGEMSRLLGNLTANSEAAVQETNRIAAPSTTRVQPSSIPGLELASHMNQSDNPNDTARSEAGTYTSSRMLTPSVYRYKETKENNMPYKDFGVQTEMDYGDITEPKQTESKGKVKKVIPKSRRQTRTLSGPEEKSKGPKRSWGYGNQKNQKFISQSERDPFFTEKQELESGRKEARKGRLLKQIAANASHLPSGIRPAGQKDSTSLSSKRTQSKLKLNDKEKVQAYSKKNSVLRDQTSRTQTIMSQNSYAQRQKSPVSSRQETEQPVSKPVNGGTELLLAERLRVSPTDEFVPFMRSDEVLSASKANQPAPLSREATRQILAREAYHKTMQPAQYGQMMHNIKDQSHSNASTYTRGQKDPLYNPSIVTKHPTERQQQMLEQLRQMRQGLLAKQREIDGIVEPQQLQNSQSYHNQ